MTSYDTMVPPAKLGKPKFRICTNGKRYWIQKRFLWFWNDVRVIDEIRGGMILTKPVTFDSFQEADQYVINLVPKKKPAEIVVQTYDKEANRFF